MQGPEQLQREHASKFRCELLYQKTTKWNQHTWKHPRTHKQPREQKSCQPRQGQHFSASILPPYDQNQMHQRKVQEVLEWIVKKICLHCSVVHLIIKSVYFIFEIGVGHRDVSILITTHSQLAECIWCKGLDSHAHTMENKSTSIWKPDSNPFLQHSSAPWQHLQQGPQLLSVILLMSQYHR